MDIKQTEGIEEVCERCGIPFEFIPAIERMHCPECYIEKEEAFLDAWTRKVQHSLKLRMGL